jgi:hypothetical protein
MVNTVFPFGVTIQGPGSIPCGESRTYRVVGYYGVGPYSGYHVLDHFTSEPFATGETFTIQAGSTFQQLTLEPRASDARGEGYSNIGVINTCG